MTNNKKLGTIVKNSPLGTQSLLGACAVFLIAFAAQSHAETYYVDCNLKGLDKVDGLQAIKLFRNRQGNNGKGNGGESIDVLVDLDSGDTTVSCVKTADEDTAGIVSIQVGGTIIPLGPIQSGEIDPNDINL
jgi:hypothetical protein